MKKKLSVLIGFIAVATLTGCQKYEEGPLFSLQSKKARVANTWKVDNYTVNNVDLTSLVGGYSETFSKDGNYSYTWGILNGTGVWKFENNAAEIKITGISNQSDRTLVILKLESKQFWYYIMNGTDKSEYHMVEK